MKFILLFAALSGMFGIVLGAFAAHGLKGRLSESLLQTFQTGVQYQIYHSLALLLVVILFRLMPSNYLVYCAAAFIMGIALFSGSLYGLALTQSSWLGPITPLGGLCFIVGWGLLAIFALKEMN